MAADALQLDRLPSLDDGRLIIGFDGWMDGGEVSTGTAEWIAQQLHTERVGQVVGDDFYLLNFPGSMEVAALFRPPTRITAGMVQELELPANELQVSVEHNVALLTGREPNLNWRGFADCVFEFARRTGIRKFCFVGSFGGAVPHTREPRLYTSFSHASWRARTEELGLRPAEYEGPASFSTLLLMEAPKYQIEMCTLVAEIPAYVQGPNPKCIEAVVRTLAGMLELPISLSELRPLSSQWEERVSAVVREKEDLAEHIEKLEEDYDNEVFDTQMGDLKSWLEKQGIRVD